MNAEIPDDHLPDLRTDYQRAQLSLADAPDDPLDWFRDWFEEAAGANLVDANAMTLATASADGRVSSRTVLLKGLDERGFQFFTNFQSRKARNLAENPAAALTFYWPALERQICVRGQVSRLSDAESDAYFASRPYGSRIGAWVSTQTEEISGRDWLEVRDAEFREKYPETGPVPRPPFWGGYVLAPIWVEFWQGRASRLHDRIGFERETGSSAWRKFRLSP